LGTEKGKRGADLDQVDDRARRKHHEKEVRLGGGGLKTSPEEGGGTGNPSAQKMVVLGTTKVIAGMRTEFKSVLKSGAVAAKKKRKRTRPEKIINIKGQGTKVCNSISRKDFSTNQEREGEIGKTRAQAGRNNFSSSDGRRTNSSRYFPDQKESGSANSQGAAQKNKNPKQG